MLKYLNSRISVIIATLNEEEGIGATLSEFKKVVPKSQFIVVDGRSLDRTVEIAKDLDAEVIVQAGEGKGDALSLGVKHIRSTVRYVVFTDGDYTYPAEYVPKMLEILEQNPSVGMVIGNRFNGEHNFNKSSSNIFYVGNRFLAFAQNLLNGVDLEDPLSGLRVVRASILKDWRPKSKGFDIEAEMNFQVERAGYKIVELPIRYRRRLGEKKLKMRHGLEIMKRIIIESLSM
ncbi:MAG: glycosyltransferase family 2 protein [Candidatus Bathyarchaeia archaeon]